MDKDNGMLWSCMCSLIECKSMPLVQRGLTPLILRVVRRSE